MPPPGVYYCFFFQASGELYTFGRTGPRLGYSTEGRKQAVPKAVEALKGLEIKNVACGLEFTLGRLLSCFQSFVRLKNAMNMRVEQTFSRGNGKPLRAFLL